MNALYWSHRVISMALNRHFCRNEYADIFPTEQSRKVNSSSQRPTPDGFIHGTLIRLPGAGKHQFLRAPREAFKLRQNTRRMEFAHQTDMRKQRPRFLEKSRCQQFFLKYRSQCQERRRRFAATGPENLVVFPVTQAIETNIDCGIFNARSKLEQLRLATYGNLAKKGQRQMHGILRKHAPATTVGDALRNPVQRTPHSRRRPQREKQPRRNDNIGFTCHDQSSPPSL